MILKDINRSQSVTLDLVKFLMLLWIIIGHAVALTLPKFDSLDLGTVDHILTGLVKVIFGFGREYAVIFIYLSGFFTAPSLFRVKNSRNSVVAICARINRLMPFLWFALLLTMGLDWLGLSVFDLAVYKSNSMTFNVNEHYSMLILGGNAIGLQPTVVNTLGSNGPLWTLGYLLQFYFLMAIVKIYISDKIQKKIFWFIIITIIVAFLTKYDFLYFFAIWMFGAYSRYIQIMDRRSKLYVGTLIGIAFMLICVARLMPPGFSFYIGSAAGFFILLISKQSILSDKVASLVSSRKFLFQLGFAAYTIHMPILFFLAGLTLEWLGGTHLSSIQFPLFILTFLFILGIASSIFSRVANFVSNHKFLEIN